MAEKNLKEHVEQAGESKKWFLTGKDIKWLASMLITIIIAGSSILFLYKDRNNVRDELQKSNDKVEQVVEENVELKNRISKIEGKQEGTQEAIKLFLEHPPSIMQKQIDQNTKELDEIMDRFNIHHSEPTVDTTRVNTRYDNRRIGN